MSFLIGFLQARIKYAALAGAALFFLVSTGALGFVLMGVRADLSRAKTAITKTETQRDEANRKLGVCEASQSQLRAEIDSQNAAVARMAEEAVTAEKIGLRRLAEAQAEATRYRTRADQLAKARPGPDQCASAHSLIVETLSEERGQ
jgi:hypothetical protein